MTDQGFSRAVAVLPAAGAARRMGRPKLLLPYRDTTIVGAVVESLRRGGAGRIAVVAAPGDEALQAWVRGASLFAARGASLLVAVNPAPERGMLSSIRAGLAALGGAEEIARRGEVLLVCPADLPALRPETVAELLRRREAAGAPLAVPVHHGKRGHPLAIAPALVAEVWSLDLDAGLRQILDRHAGELLRLEVDDPGAVSDVDTPEDYARLMGG